ncbi:PREDICTED: protein NRT1/ PTR FAMILY 2.8 [Tarenaya hassleriana]|uniref:protein NRT1/ PTR FAMILY 2.8 n=1 Tax=Tarenaya hassleriana TaxID=28532 RepID=UPI00053C4FD6|nr:PREDICTED: protein NRT1/ PTR FAMILY 2.8 [Tarenaya hassleriana]
MEVESSSSSSPSRGDGHHEPEDQSSRKKKRGGWRAVKYILGNESFEKLASMSLIANLTVYLQNKYNIGGVFLVNIVTIWSGLSNISAVAGAFVSDAYLGRFWTLLLGSIASFLGMGMMALTAALPKLRPRNCSNERSECPKPEPLQLVALFTGLGLLALGAGGVRPCNIAFGADQFDTNTPKGKAQLETFFNWWYFSFTVALVIALTGVVYIQSNISWFIGFLIPTACLLLSITIFLFGRHTYICAKPQGSVFSDMFKVVAAALRKRKVKISDDVTFYDAPLDQPGSSTRLLGTDRLGFLDKASIVMDPNEINEEGRPRNDWRLCSLQQVKNLKCVLGVLPVWVAGIACFMLMDQQNTFGILQAIQMDKSIGPHFRIPPGWMNLVSMVALSAWILAYECICIPATRFITGRNRRLTIKQRIEIGIVMGIACMVVAGFLEKKRRASALRNGSFVSSISVLLLLPQFALSGLMEAFSCVALMEFLTMRMPEHMRTVAGAIFFLSSSMASYISTLLVDVIHNVTSRGGKSPWLGGRDLNKNRLEYYYFIIGAIEFVNLMYFRFFAGRFASENI